MVRDILCLYRCNIRIYMALGAKTSYINLRCMLPFRCRFKLIAPHRIKKVLIYPIQTDSETTNSSE